MVAWCVAALFLAPILWAVVRSLEPSTDVTQAPSASVLLHLGDQSYRTLFSGSIDILVYLRNSLALGGGTAALTAVVATLAGYGFAKYRQRWMSGIFLSLLAIFMIPFQAIVIPLLQELHDLRLSNSLVGLALVDSTFSLPFCLFIMRNTFLDIPVEIEEAAMTDGASMLQRLFLVLRPLVMPGIVSCCLYAFLYSWTEFLAAITFLDTQSRFTLPIELLNLEIGAQGVVNYGVLEAGAVITMVPCVIIYTFLQRYYVAGLVSGGVKG